MRGAPDVLVVGSYAAGLTMRARRAPGPGETVEGYDYRFMHGGKGSNQSVACARLGANVALLACTGDDDYGRAARDLWRVEGVASEYVVVHRELPTGVGFIIVDERGENQIVVDFGANRSLSAAHVVDATARIPGIGVCLTQLEINPETAAAAMRAGRAAGAVTILNPAPACELPGEIWKDVDVLTPNESEARLLLGLADNQHRTPSELCDALRSLGVGAVALTLGARGVYLDSPDYQGEIAAPIVNAVDTTGAGDTFSAALAVSAAEGRGIVESVEFAVRAAAISVTRYGVIPSIPRRSEID